MVDEVLTQQTLNNLSARAKIVLVIGGQPLGTVLAPILFILYIND